MTDLVRASLNLTARSAEALQSLVELTGDSKTDCMNRAVQVYSFLVQAVGAGGKVLLEDSDGCQERVLFI